MAKRNRRIAGQPSTPDSRKLPNVIDRESVSSGSRVSVKQLRESFGINRKVFSRVSGYSERAIAQWEANKPLSGAGRQRINELHRLQQALASVMREGFVAEWLQAPNRAFDGLKPIEVIERGEVDRIWRMIYELESGMPT